MGHGLVVDHRPFLEEVVDGAGHRLLVARDGRGGQDDRVAGHDRDVPMVAVAHPGQAGHRLALGAGGHDHQPDGSSRSSWSFFTTRAVPPVEVAQLGGDGRVLLHGSTDEHDLAAVLRGGIDGLLHPTDVRGEGGHDHAALGRPDQLAERLRDRGLRQGVALALGTGRVGQEEVHALPPPLGDEAQVGPRPVRRGVVELEVAGVDDRAAGVADGEPHAARNGVVDPERGDPERADRELDARLDHVEPGGAQELVLLQLAGDQADGQLGGIDRGPADPGQDVRQAAGVVLVAVGQDDPAHRVTPFGEIRGVGHDQVDAEHVRVGEGQTAVDDDDLVIGLDHGDVLADLADTAQRNDAKCSCQSESFQNSVS